MNHVRMLFAPRPLAALGLGLAGLAAIGAIARATTAVAPSNTLAPVVTGEAQEGAALRAEPGEWSGDRPIDFSYQWRRCNTTGASCSNIGLATDQIYAVRRADVGRTVRVLVTAANDDGAATAQSKPTGTITAAPAQAPRSTKEPSIAGAADEGATLTADGGSWEGSQPIQLVYRWRRCDAKGGDCVSTGVTTQTYRLGQDDVGHTLRVLITATNAAGAGAAISNPTAIVQAATPAPGQCQPVASVTSPQRLVVDRIVYEPTRIRTYDEPLVARFHVGTTRGFCVHGALVYALGVPFNRLSAGSEVQTDASGWAEVVFDVKPTFALRPGNLVVIFVRARRAGDSVLAGVSTRRLVSVRVG